MLRRLPLLLPALLAVAAPAHAATVAVEGDVLRVVAAPGEYNRIALGQSDSLSEALPLLTVLDEGGARLIAGAGCEPADDDEDSVSCRLAARVDVDAGDGGDSVAVYGALPAILRGGEGDDALSGGEADDALEGGEGSDVLDAGNGNDSLDGADGDDSLEAGDGNDRLDGAEGNDSLDAGDGDDSLDGAEGNDSLEAGDGEDTLAGAAGDDSLGAGDGDDTLAGAGGDDLLDAGAGHDMVDAGDGNDSLYGGDGDDRLLGRRGADRADGGAGHDRIEVRDRLADSTLCGSGRDFVRAEVLDSLDFACERVDYGPAGRVGRLRTRTGGGRFVPVPGQPGTTVDRRILPDVLQLIRRYHIDLGDCFARTGHTPRGEHPLGLACDIVPGAGGSWDAIDRLARWAEPRQNRPRPPFSWVGYRGDADHGRGDHLHLSWAHSPGPRFRPVRTVWVWQVRGA